MKKIFLAIAITMAVVAPKAKAEVVEKTLSWFRTGWYYAGDTLTYNFPNPTYVERLLISAEGSRNYASATVYADGEQVSLMGVPGNDPDYPVVIRKIVSSVVIKFQGTIKIKDMRAYVDEAHCHHCRMNEIRHGDRNSPQGLAETALSVIAILHEDVIMEENFKTYLLPIRKAALRLAASGGGRTFLSGKTREKAIVLINKIKAAEGYFDVLSQNEKGAEAVKILLYVQNKLESSYEIYD